MQEEGGVWALATSCETGLTISLEGGYFQLIPSKVPVYSQKATELHILQRLGIWGLFGWTEGTPGVNTVTPVIRPRVDS